MERNGYIRHCFFGQAEDRNHDTFKQMIVVIDPYRESIRRPCQTKEIRDETQRDGDLWQKDIYSDLILQVRRCQQYRDTIPRLAFVVWIEAKGSLRK